MNAPYTVRTEQERLAALDAYGILDTPPERAFDDIVAMVGQLLDAPIVAVNLLAEGRQWFKSEIGLGTREMPLDDSICKFALFQQDRMVVPDTRLDPRFSANPLVTGAPGLRFYAGELLLTPDGLVLGTLCVLDLAPRPQGLTAQQANVLATMANQVMRLIELHKALRDQQVVQEALRRERDQSQRLFEGMDEGFVLLDAQFRLRQINTEALRYEPRSAEELLGLTHWEAWPGSEDLFSAHQYKHAMAERVPVNFEQNYIFPDGRSYWLDIRAMPADDGLAVFYRDITERKETEEALRQADQKKDEFLAMLAHELRNPLAPITSAAAILSNHAIDANTVRRTSAIIARQAKHMTGLIDDLLDVSRVTRGRVDLATTELDIKDVIADAIEQVRPLVEKHEHRLLVQLAPLPSIVLGDRKRLVQVMTNLLSNAAKYTPNGGAIEVLLEAEGGTHLITVRDNGIGMSPELIVDAFELFSQGKRSLDRSQGGLGIGLALVKSLLLLHGGTVTIHSDGLDRGTSFRVRLPALARSGADADGVAPAAPNGMPAQLRIGIVDDNEDAAATLCMFLQAYGHEVTIAHSGRQALREFPDFGPDVCLLDIGLPGMDGFDLARALRAAPETRGAVLIAITGYAQEKDRQEARGAGFDELFAKPVDLAALNTLLMQVAQHRLGR